MTDTQIRFDSSTLVFDGGEGDVELSIDGKDFAGWDDNGEMRRAAIEYAQAHGSYDLRGFQSSRLVVFGGLAGSASPESQQALRNAVTGIIPDGQRDRMVVDHQGLTLHAYVRLERASWAIETYGSVARYQLQMWAADPRKYGQAERFPTEGTATSVEVFNRGNFPALPVYTIAGDMPNGYELGAGASRYRVSTPVTPGHPHTFCTRTGKHWVDGRPVIGGIERFDRWVIQPHHLIPVTETFIDLRGGTGGFSVEVPPTYV
ncbi:hypothetical protein SCB71_14385 [Herbiconiux sp. KACC 21604]|uniref:hypothetical protein n=1 Tax=unclassified Herbiconiux TaxID=2618217 RepID=UPI0014916E40|nr:hypothetical protein [Herbiconiux sp. SALV-R1]QJU54330.1 hypothetical protein HL652_12325 [Herbiconiux sp. SALV-R1]WPO85400.1 hypothetical protein SCB71_14385 [Herbiconiux sp. KACC 21604]